MESNSALWTEADILAMIEIQAKESIYLDYKSSGAIAREHPRRREDVSKDVSAFANSAGGTIVYGVREEVNLPIEIDGGFDPREVSREWLEQVINSTIQTRINGIRINQIELTTTSPGRVIYAVAIPKSIQRAPHQASDHKYYKRFNFESVPMEDFEVRDVMLRSEGPDLYCSLEFDAGLRQVLEHTGNYGGTIEISDPINLHVKIGNRAIEPAQHAVIYVHIDHRLRVMNHPFSWPYGEFDPEQYFELMGTTYPVTRGRIYWPQHVDLPIFRGVELAALEDPLQLQVPFGHPHTTHDFIVATTIMAPRMEPKTDHFTLTDDHHVLTIHPAEGWLL